MFNFARIFDRTDPMWTKFREEADRKAMFTPDIADIQDQYAHNIFIYNECMRGNPQHNVLGEASLFGGLAYTESSDFVLYTKKLGRETYPFALPITDDHKMGRSSLIGDPGQIMGEVYSIRPDALISLDNYMLNTVQFERKRVKVVRPYHPDEKSALEVHTTEVWMYIGSYEFWKDQINDAEAKKLFIKTPRLFATKDSNNKETLGAYYIFDYNFETSTP